MAKKKPFGNIKKGTLTRQIGKPTLTKENKILKAKEGSKVKVGGKTIIATGQLKKRANFAKNARSFKHSK